MQEYYEDEGNWRREIKIIYYYHKTKDREHNINLPYLYLQSSEEKSTYNLTTNLIGTCKLEKVSNYLSYKFEEMPNHLS